MKQIKRKTYLIKRKMQLGFFFRFMLLALLEVALVWKLLAYVASNTVTTGYVDYALKVESTQSFFFVQLVMILLVVSVGMGMVGMAVFIMLSHRVAGPLYRIERDLEVVKKGDLTKRIIIRRTDQTTELRDSINSILEDLDGRMSRARIALSSIRSLVRRSGDTASSEKLDQAIKDLNREIDFFKVSQEPKE